MENNKNMPNLLFERGVFHTLEETGRFLGITRERVRQIEQRALAKLRKRLLAEGITCLSDMI